ncbi:MAG: NAD(P)-dependent oxidoreductase [Rikenellaceae bacterium]
MAKILITGAIKLIDSIQSKITDLGLDIVFVQNELEPIQVDISDVEYVICNGLFLHNDISKFTSLRYIQVTSAGLDRLPMEQVAERGIVVNNARGVYSVPMAEWAMAAILSLYKNIPTFLKNQAQHKWIKDREVRELSGSKALVVGMGSVGQQVAKRLWAMGVTVEGVDVAKMEFPYIERCHKIDELQTIIGDCDIVVLTLPLTPDTYHIINSDLLGIMQSDAILVNISRGAVINESDLIEVLNDGEIAGAALDVFECEPLDHNSPLWDMANIIITPHNSFVSPKNAARLEGVIVENLQQYISNNK